MGAEQQNGGTKGPKQPGGKGLGLGQRETPGPIHGTNFPSPLSARLSACTWQRRAPGAISSGRAKSEGILLLLLLLLVLLLLHHQPQPCWLLRGRFGGAPCTPTAAAPSTSHAAAAQRSLMPSGTIPVITSACWCLCSGIKHSSQHRVGFLRGFCTAQHPEGRRSGAVCPSVCPSIRGWSSRGAEGSPSCLCMS